MSSQSVSEYMSVFEVINKFDNLVRSNQIEEARKMVEDGVLKPWWNDSSALLVPIQCNQHDLVKLLLEKGGVPCKEYFLEKAIENENMEMVRMLLDSNAQPTSNNVVSAGKRGNREILEMLFQYEGTEPTVDAFVMEKVVDGDTFLEWVDFLVEKGMPNPGKFDVLFFIFQMLGMGYKDKTISKVLGHSFFQKALENNCENSIYSHTELFCDYNGTEKTLLVLFSHKTFVENLKKIDNEFGKHLVYDLFKPYFACRKSQLYKISPDEVLEHVIKFLEGRVSGKLTPKIKIGGESNFLGDFTCYLLEMEDEDDTEYEVKTYCNGLVDGVKVDGLRFKGSKATVLLDFDKYVSDKSGKHFLKREVEEKLEAMEEEDYEEDYEMFDEILKSYWENDTLWFEEVKQDKKSLSSTDFIKRMRSAGYDDYDIKRELERGLEFLEE